VAFWVAAFLLLSMGGAIIAAPITVPLMFVATRQYPTRAFRIAGSVLTAFTIAELVWALTYFAFGEAKPWIWLVPLIAVIVATIAFWSRTAPGERREAGVVLT
jgi:hypothetical protein